jgi:stage III sporulation protein AD
MVENIIMVIGLCLVAAVLSKVLERYNKEQSIFLAIAACVVVLIFIFIYISPVINVMNNLFEKSGTNENYSGIIVKSLGICYVTQLGFDICKDCNENALATVVEIAGKVSLIIIAIPLLEKLIELVNTMI